jgi:stage II sporulation protein D
MILRSFFVLLIALLLFNTAIFAIEPTVRIGLSTNARSVSVTTSDSSLVSVSPGEQSRTLATTKVTVLPRAYRPPVIEKYRFEIPNITTREEADQIAKDAKEAMSETTSVILDLKTNTFRVKIDETFDSIEEANAFKESLAEKGFDDAEMMTDKITLPSTEAVLLSQQVNTNSNSEVRSLIKPTVLSIPTSTEGVAVDPNLKEIIVSGGNEKFSSFKPIAFGSLNERGTPIKINGKAYRGKVEVFVNTRGTLTVVNVVPMEDYLRGVVPNELGLPELEAQKAQAVAARTYAWANFNGFASQGFDLLPTTRSQVYRGYSSENSNATRAILETTGIVAMYRGKPINAMYTSTCGGRTENVENIYEHDEPYLRGVECSLENNYFDIFSIKTSRDSARIKDENKLPLVRETSLLATGGFTINAGRFSDEWFDATPTNAELQTWFSSVTARLPRPTIAMPTIQTNSLPLPTTEPTPFPTPQPTPFPLPSFPTDAKPANVANYLAAILYGQGYADTLLSQSDADYQLSFDDGKDVPANARANTAILLRDGWLSLYSDTTLRPNQPMSRAKILRLIYRLATKKNWLANLQTGTTKSSVDGKLIIKSGKSEKQLTLKSDVYLFRQFGESLYQVKETALVGGESVNYQTNSIGEVTYLEVKPTTQATVPDRVSSFSFWNTNLSPSAVQSRLARYVKGFGSLIDVRVSKIGVSRRAIELEIVGSNGVFKLNRGKIRSALKLKEQLFVLNKKYDANGRVTGYNFTGRGWGHGIGMCQYGAYGLAKMGVKYDKILKHYYSGIELKKEY